MKSTTLFAFGLLAATALCSCNLDNDIQEQTVSSTMSQLVIPDDASKEVTFQHKCMYSLKMNLNASTVEITGNDIRIGASSNDIFLGPVKYAYGYNGVAESYTFRNAQGRYGSQEVENASGYLTTLMPVVTRTPALVMSYHTAGATVKTFMRNPLFGGTTTTYYYMGPEPTTAETKDATYGIVFSDDMTTATVVIYNIKFAPQSPKMDAVMLNNLTVTLGRHGYTITGQDIVPEVPEGNTTTPYRNFPFKSFTLSTCNDMLTEINCAYTVEATIGERTMTFRGEFTGLSSDYMRTEETEK